MPAWREKASATSQNAATAGSDRVITRFKSAARASYRQKGDASQAEKPKQHAHWSNAKPEAGESFPHRVSLGPLHRESFNNGYHCGFAQ